MKGKNEGERLGNGDTMEIKYLYSLYTCFVQRINTTSDVTSR